MREARISIDSRASLSIPTGSMFGVEPGFHPKLGFHGMDGNLGSHTCQTPFGDILGDKEGYPLLSPLPNGPELRVYNLRVSDSQSPLRVVFVVFLRLRLVRI